MVLLNKEATEKLQKGVNIVADAVKTTMGAKGRSVIIEKEYGYPSVTKDGVTVARHVYVQDEAENIGATMMKEVANKTVEMSGDGTTCSIVLAQSLINKGIEAIENGADAISIKEGIEQAKNEVLAELKLVSREATTDLLPKIATISANGDTEIGRFVAEVVEKVGVDGVVHVEKGNTNETIVNMVEGYKIERGYLSPNFVTEMAKMQCILENPYILITDKKLTHIKELDNILAQVHGEGRELLIVSNDMTDELLTTLVVNKMKGILKICVVRPPFMGGTLKEVLTDLAIVTGGTFITEEFGFRVESATTNLLGTAKKIIISKESTIIIEGNGEKEKISQRVAQIESQLVDAQEDYEKDLIKHRISTIRGTIATIKVGGVTDSEIGEKKDRIDDAICATRSAIEEGFVAGGGTTFVEIGLKLDKSNANPLTIDGKGILLDSLFEPLTQICKNAGIELEDYSHIKNGMGYNVKTMQLENMIEAGIIDPTKVLRIALENACSIATLFLTTNCVITKQRNETTK